MAQPAHDSNRHPATFAVSTTRERDGHRVMIDGELDMATEPQLAAHLELLDGEIVLDCSDLTFIDSRGISLFVKTHQRLSADGGRLVITGLAPNCRKPLELMNLESVLNLAT